jgi:hypothetical protein
MISKTISMIRKDRGVLTPPALRADGKHRVPTAIAGCNARSGERAARTQPRGAARCPPAARKRPERPATGLPRALP